MDYKCQMLDHGSNSIVILLSVSMFSLLTSASLAAGRATWEGGEEPVGWIVGSGAEWGEWLDLSEPRLSSEPRSGPGFGSRMVDSCLRMNCGRKLLRWTQAKAILRLTWMSWHSGRPSWAGSAVRRQLGAPWHRGARAATAPAALCSTVLDCF